MSKLKQENNKLRQENEELRALVDKLKYENEFYKLARANYGMWCGGRHQSELTTEAELDGIKT